MKILSKAQSPKPKVQSRSAENDSGLQTADCGLNRGFTMIEIALCLAIIGFALVAIIAVLPTGLNVQRDNREETIINQDAVVWVNSIHNGAQGYNDLTNYVICITNFWSRYHQVDLSNSMTEFGHDDYTRTYSRVTSINGIGQDE